MIADATLPASLTIETIGDGFAALISAETHTAMSFSIDASQTEVITTPGVQLLLALDHTLEKKNIQIYLMSPTLGFKESFRLLGLEGKLDKWGCGNETRN